MAQPALHDRLRRRQFGTRVDAHQFGGGRLDGGDPNLLGAGHFDDIGEVIFALGIVGAHRQQPARHVLGGGAEDAGVAQVDRTFGVGGVGPLDDPLDMAVAQDHAAVTARIGRPERQQGQARVARPPPFQQALQRIRPDQRVIGVEYRDLTGAEMVHRLKRGVRGA